MKSESMKCLIVATAPETHLKSKGDIKPLIPILGVPSIERVIRSAIAGGVDEFHVVTGYQGEKVADFLKQLSQRLDVVIDIIHDDDCEKGNCFSVFKAWDAMKEPFLLLRTDHLFDPSIIRALQEQSLNKGEVMLAVDTNQNNPLVDKENATKICIKNENILKLGKNLENFNGFDTGLMLCTPAIFKSWQPACQISQDMSLDSAISALAASQRAKFIQTREFWIKVHDANSYMKAEKALIKLLQGKSNDNLVCRWWGRSVSIHLSKAMVNFNITPNQISFCSFLLAAIAAGLFAQGDYSLLVLGGMASYFSYILDNSDGEVARLKYLSSDYGGWFDAVLDRYADAFLLFGLTWYVYSQNLSPLALWIGFFAILGSFMSSYTADKYDKLMANRIKKGMRLGLDFRRLVIFLGAIFNQAYLVLIVTAILMNWETIRRIIICKNDE